ncbi:MAG: transglutaminase family protein [Calditrichaceae bacterium]
MRVWILVFLFFSLSFAENYLLNGGQKSVIEYKMVQKVFPDEGTQSVTISFVEPSDFTSPTYNQTITNLTINPTIPAEKTERSIDDRGNNIIKYVWSPPFKPFEIEIALRAENNVELQTLKTQASFPPKSIPADAAVYIKSSTLAPSDDPRIQAKAKELTAGAKTEFDAVQKILSWVIDHMHYVLMPEDYNALYSFDSGKGNCQNYSHLAAALMRASGIPARIVNGITLKDPFDIDVGGQRMTLNMAQGRHSWIEVYFPDLGWVPFDPQQTQLFVSNRFIRVEVGLDNEETMNDGLIRWTRLKGSSAKVAFEEIIEGNFESDQVNISGKREAWGPRKMMLTPAVEAQFAQVIAAKPEPPKPVVTGTGEMEKPFITGNLEFPEGVNFIFARESHKSDGEGMELRKNFLVETAEYVTSQTQFAQTFVLDREINLMEVGLALHKFGGSGRLWLELREDNNGQPSAEVAVKSKQVDIRYLSAKPGYEWVDFSFEHERLRLTPDRYWIVLSYSGSPIINWFYSYGKPVGPVDGTRYKTAAEADFARTLGYEFNYRVRGISR